MEDKQTQIAERLFLLGVSAIAIKSLLNFSSLIHILGISDYVYELFPLFDLCFLACMSYKLLVLNRTKTKFLAIVLLGLCCVFTYLQVNYYYLIVTYFMIVSISDVDIKRICKRLLKINTYFISVHVVMYIFYSIANSSVINYNYRPGSNVARHTFFLEHSNTFTMYLTWTCLMYIYIAYSEGKLSNHKLIVLWLVNIIFYVFTQSNTGIIVLTLIVFTLILLRKGINAADYFVNKLSKYGFALCSVVFPLSVVFYNNYNSIMKSIFFFFNDLFTGRLLYGAVLFDTYGWTLMGSRIYLETQKVHWQGFWFDGLGNDNTYIWMFVSYGAIYLILISIGFILISKRTNTIEKVLIIAYVLYGIMEAYIINCIFCFPLLFIGKYLFERDKERYR